MKLLSPGQPRRGKGIPQHGRMTKASAFHGNTPHNRVRCCRGNDLSCRGLESKSTSDLARAQQPMPRKERKNNEHYGHQCHEAALFPDDQQFWYETQRALGHTADGGADIGEVVTTAARITAGDYDSWYDQWAATAQRTEAEARGQLVAGFLRGLRSAGTAGLPWTPVYC